MRTLLSVSGLGLLGYVVYRYSLFQPPEHGTIYGVIFPLSTLLALSALLLAWRPDAIASLPPEPRAALRFGLGSFGTVWMATGMACARSLADGVVEAPLGGTIDLVHMLSDHLFLPVAVVALAWVPERVERWLGGGGREATPIGDVAFGTAGD